jgi:hypothetical protein
VSETRAMLAELNSELEVSTINLVYVKRDEDALRFFSYYVPLFSNQC